MMNLSLDRRQFDASVRASLSATQQAKVGAVGALAVQLGAAAITHSPVDTGRFRNATVQSVNDVIRQAGSERSFAVPPLKESKVGTKIEARLIKQLRFWLGRKKHLEATGQAFYKTRRGVGETKNYRKAKKRVGLAWQYLNNFRRSKGTAASIGIDTWQRVYSHGDEERLIKSYDKVYGGRGQIVLGEDQAGMVLVNMEPHARIVEARKRVMAIALRVVSGGTGSAAPLVKVHQAYMAKVVKAWSEGR